jgi:hypothetical protein
MCNNVRFTVVMLTPIPHNNKKIFTIKINIQNIKGKIKKKFFFTINWYLSLIDLLLLLHSKLSITIDIPIIKKVTKYMSLHIELALHPFNIDIQYPKYKPKSYP